jgi:two-component system chemotaxis sensor kinase CheA
MTPNLSEIQRQLLGTFFEESFEGLEQLEAGLLTLESAQGGDNTETINDIFRVAHSLKGGAGSFGLNLVGDLGHAMETLLDAFRAGRLAPNPDSLSLLLASVDGMRGLLEAVRDSRDYPGEPIETLRRGLALAADQPALVPAAAPEKPALKQRAFRIHFAPHPTLLETGNEPVRLLREVARLGSASVTADVSALPALADLNPNLLHLRWDLELRGEVSEAQILDVFSWVESDATIVVKELLPASEPESVAVALAPLAPRVEPDPAATATAQGKPGPAAARPDSADGALGSIRVSVDKIDLLMNMVGELVITQSMLGELDGDGPLDAQRIERLREGLGLLARNTRSIQESVMRLRSMPISMVFNRFPRLVHDLARQLGKQVELKIIGQSTELDKTVLEKLGDPLVHLVRNCMDHGLEPPEARRAAGKSEVGTLQLSAYHRGGDIVVEVIDDGRGIDRERVIKRAREVGILGPDEVPATDDALRDILFAPGFSTAAKVTDLSGRGVGMDVVRRNIRSLGGDVFLESTPGKGTRISLRLPLTLAIIDGQLIRVGDYSYVIPLLSIVESVQIEAKRVTRLHGRFAIYRLRDELIPMIDLAKVLGLKLEQQRTDDGLMVIVEADGEHVGLLVDELLAQQQVVVKSLETNYGRIEGLAGATILGDGGVAFILDAAGIGRLVRAPAPREGARAA